MTTRRVVIAAAVVAAIALVGGGTFALLRTRSSGRSAPSTTTTTTTIVPPVTTAAPQTIPVPPLPPAGPTTAPPPAITIPQGTVGTAPPSSATPPTVTAPPASTTTPDTSTTKPPTSTTKPPTSTTKPTTSTTKPNKITRRTVVYSPPGAPKLRGDLALPRDHADTIVVLAHPGSAAGGKKQMRPWADSYARHGYPTFAIEYLVPTPTTPSPVYPKPETDVKAAIQYLRQQAGALGVDPERIVVQGFSTGAALGAQAVVTPNDPFFSGPRHYPNVSDAPAAFVGFSGLYDGTQRDPNRYFGGPPDSPDPQVQQRYAKANSIAQAAGAAGPVLLYAAENDDPAAVQSATSFRDALQSSGKDVTLTQAPATGAGFDQQVAQQVLDWLSARFPPS